MMRRIYIVLSLLLLAVMPMRSQTAEDVVRQIIDSRHRPNIHDYDYVSSAMYEKSQVAINDIDLLNTDTKFFRKHPNLRSTIERNHLNNKFVLPVFTDQKIIELLWRKNPRKTRYNVIAINRDGLDDIINFDDFMEYWLGDEFIDFNIYDDTLRMKRKECVSPLSHDAMEHYNYDLVMSTDSVANIVFEPKERYTQGLSGNMLVTKDSLWRVKMVTFSIPITKSYKHIDKLYLSQEYGATLDNNWVLMRSDLVLEMKKKKTLGQVCYINSIQYSHISVDSIPDKMFRSKSKWRYDGMCEYRDPSFWVDYDRDLYTQLQQTRTDDSLHCSQTIQEGNKIVRHRQSYNQRRINELLDYTGHITWFKPVAVTLKSLINNYIEVGNPPIFNIEPVTALISYNDVDKWRFRFGGNTTANLNRQLFFGGYLAYGTSTKNVYYQAKGTYSFLKKEYEASEFPRRNINLESRYDICYLGERNSHTDHDNFFKSYHWDKNSQMMFFKMQRLELERDERNGIGDRFSMKREEDRATGGLIFKSMRDVLADQIVQDLISSGSYSVDKILKTQSGTLDNGRICTTELRFELLYSPRYTRYTSSKPRVPINNEWPSAGIAHTIGVKMLGGQYYYHLTELKVSKDWYLGTLGLGHTMVKMGAIWNTVPYPLLLAPPANISYVNDPESFSLISTSGFINDQYLQLMLSWETNGNVIGLIPLIKKLRWKEYLAVRMLWGGLRDDNNPTLMKNINSDVLMPIPDNVYVMNSKIPYVEGVIGIHNIFRFLNVDYIYRFTYRDLPNANMGGFRFSVKLNF